MGHDEYISIEYHVLEKSLQKQILLRDFKYLKELLKAI